MNIPNKTKLKMLCLAVFGALALAPVLAGSAPTVTFKSLLAEMVDNDAVAQWPQPAYATRMTSSFDPASKTPDDAKGWFANRDWSRFMRCEAKSGGTEWVMMEASGPGCLTRLWYGGMARPGKLRIYIDGGADPVFDEPLAELLSGRGSIPSPFAVENSPVVQEKKPGGLNLFLPIPYAKSIRIVYFGPEPKQPDMFFFNIEHRDYPAGTKLKSFSAAEFRSLRKFAASTAAVLSNPEPRKIRRHATLEKTIPPAGEVAVELPEGAAAVRELKLRVTAANAANTASVLRTTILKGTFDGGETIWCPVGDFAGSGAGLNALQSWYRTVETNGLMTIRWTMPYAKSAKFTLQNLGAAPVTVSLDAGVSPWKWDERSMHFYCTWRSERSIPKRPFRDWNYLTATGQGVYLGDTLTVHNLAPTGGPWWGEGDEKIWVDDGKFPALFGTGTEDYYCYAWGNTDPFQSPFANQVRCNSSQQGYTVVTRTRNLDRIPFKHRLQFEMEIWTWSTTATLDYAVASYWYARPGAKHNRVPQPEEAVAPIK